MDERYGGKQLYNMDIHLADKVRGGQHDKYRKVFDVKTDSNGVMTFLYLKAGNARRVIYPFESFRSAEYYEP